MLSPHLCSGTSKRQAWGSLLMVTKCLFYPSTMQTFQGNQHKMKNFGLLLMDFHLYIKFIWMQEKLSKWAKGTHQEAHQQTRAHMGPQVGSPDAPWCLPRQWYAWLVMWHVQEHIHTLISNRFDPKAINTCHMDWRAHCHTQTGVTYLINWLLDMQPPYGVRSRS